jgi:hypothetical protein
MLDAFRCYIPKSEIDRIQEEFGPEEKEAHPRNENADAPARTAQL